MKDIIFDELTKKVHLIKDLILSDLTTVSNNAYAEESFTFNKHLLSTKYWYARISWANKKRFALALLEDVRSAWTLSLLLKSTWNCRPKDAVLSICESDLLSSYDQVPMDHNRTAQPISTLAQVMKSERKWFLTLEPEPQAMVLTELMTICGGPIMWAVMDRARTIYERYRSDQLTHLQQCVVVNDAPHTAGSSPDSKGHSKKDQATHEKVASHVNVGGTGTSECTQAQKQLDAHLAAWNATIKSLRDNLKLEEVEMTFSDGSKQKLWKVNRPKPEAIETVDFLQMLPSSIGKRILSHLPIAQLGDYARVNKYWAYLVDEFRAEVSARQKLNTDTEKLQELMLRHDTSMDVFAQTDQYLPVPSSAGTSVGPSTRRALPSIRPSEKSAGVFSFGHFLTEKLYKTPTVKTHMPIRNLKELTERLERRGAADENLWEWSAKVLKRARRPDGTVDTNVKQRNEGILSFGHKYFPCPLMVQSLEVPLHPPLYKDPTFSKYVKPKRNISSAAMMNIPKNREKRFSLWSRNFSSLYPVIKIPSYQSPF